MAVLLRVVRARRPVEEEFEVDPCGFAKVGGVTLVGGMLRVDHQMALFAHDACVVAGSQQPIEEEAFAFDEDS